ncbi:hypothetical protein [Maribacter sp. HTCC2170]|uniref:hypothetical protein n=1 Tax=Maribacter sp. (strain HTCC2170 / KCCM 42371) TaxID=313603 RepID=UPI00006AFCB8|nr:hypothetical protein [Maribacter sp. HTCC2170]EAR01211.1 hypothetical protein FB2170_10841 [Maribacter sp. HTCC2170]
MTEKKNKKKAKRKIFIESVFVFFITLSPFLYKIHDYFPEDPEATISFFGFVIDNNGFNDISLYVWFVMSKVIPLYLLIFWFMTAKNWWYHIILIPIAMYAFQLFEVIFDSDDYIDTENIWWLLPVCMIIIPVVYFIRIKLYDKYVHGIDLEAMDAELKSLKTFYTGEENSEKDMGQSADEHAENQATIGYQTISESINTKLSTDNIERGIKGFQNKLKTLFGGKA